MTQEVKERRLKWKLYAITKLGGKCVKCGQEDHRVLHFDHIFPKEKRFQVSQLIFYKDPQPYLDKELEICQLLCANCHTLKTLEDGTYINRSPKGSYKNHTYYSRHRGRLLRKGKDRYKLFRSSLSMDQILDMNTTKTETGCWMFGQWLMNRAKRMLWKKKRVDVRMAGWKLKTGAWADSPSDVIQTCGWKACWNPEHLKHVQEM